MNKFWKVLIAILVIGQLSRCANAFANAITTYEAEPTERPVRVVTATPDTFPCTIYDDPLPVAYKNCGIDLRVVLGDYEGNEATIYWVVFGPGAEYFADNMVGTLQDGEGMMVISRVPDFSAVIVCSVVLPSEDVGIHVYGDPDLGRISCEELEALFG